MNKSDTPLEKLRHSFERALESADNANDLRKLSAQFLGKRGDVTQLLRQIPKLNPEERKDFGAAVNQLKQQIQTAIVATERKLIDEVDTSLSPVDLSLPITMGLPSGHGHPTQLVMADIYDIFLRLGFAIIDSNEVETDWYNFEALNMPADHPAREMQDTFYLTSDGRQPALVPRTHTSAAQIRYMETHTPPFKIIVPGKVYRNEDEDRTHSWSFVQVEGLVVGEGVSMADLKGTLLLAMQGLLGDDVKIRFRPSFFPYTEPSVEVDVWYQGEWLEILGAGMVHPRVLAAGGIDPERYSGFAFGWGTDRLALPRFGLTDLRRLWRPNLMVSDQL